MSEVPPIYLNEFYRVAKGIITHTFLKFLPRVATKPGKLAGQLNYRGPYFARGVVAQFPAQAQEPQGDV